MTQSPGTVLLRAIPAPLPWGHAHRAARSKAPQATHPRKARWLSGLLALWLWAALPPVHAAINASIDNTQVGEGETVQLTLKYDGITTSEPDLRPLDRDFGILGTSTSTSVEIGTGGSFESTEVVVTLSPKRTGHLTIPSIAWDGEHSAPLTVTVTGTGAPPPVGASGTTAGRTGKVFIETSTTPTRPYVQAAVAVTVRIYTSEQLYHGSLDFSGSSATLVRKIGSDAYSSAVRNGQTYQVITRHYVLFPMRSGKLSLTGPELDAEVTTRSSSSWNPFGNFFSGLVRSTRPIRVPSKPIKLSVRPRPAGATGGYWLPARNMTLSAKWAGKQAQPGDPLTVTLDLRAVGLTAAQLPDLTALLHLPAGLKAYPDQAKLDNTVQGNMIVGSRDQTIALLADRSGRYTVEGLTVHWWDTLDNQPRTATLPSQTLTFLPAAGGTTASTPQAGTSRASTPQAPQQIAQSPPKTPPSAAHSTAKAARESAPFPWQWVSAAFAALWLATLGGWLWMRRRGRTPTAATRPASARRASQPDPSKERAAFRKACVDDDAVGARRHLLAWAEAAWGSPPAGLNALAAVFGETETAALLRELDRACYGGGRWRGQPLSAALTELPTRGTKPPRDRGLSPLYP